MLVNSGVQKRTGTTWPAFKSKKRLKDREREKVCENRREKKTRGTIALEKQKMNDTNSDDHGLFPLKDICQGGGGRGSEKGKRNKKGKGKRGKEQAHVRAKMSMMEMEVRKEKGARVRG